MLIKYLKNRLKRICSEIEADGGDCWREKVREAIRIVDKINCEERALQEQTGANEENIKLLTDDEIAKILRRSVIAYRVGKRLRQRQN